MAIVNDRHEEHDEDQISLFGSPPPSPRLSGRPASPALALPSLGCSDSGLSTSTAPATQNVGTIALPGSQPISELPIHPLALSLNHGIVHRPPAYQHQTQDAVTQNLSESTNTSIPSKPKARKKRSMQSSQAVSESKPPPRAPEFDLPDPSAPLPAHFLRNQENLLGKAGLVAGVKLATLTHTHTRGSTPSNPILVGEDDEAPILGRRFTSRCHDRPPVDPALLVAPTNEEIVSALLGRQGDIIRILQGMFHLMGNANTVSTPPTLPTGFKSSAQTKAANSDIPPLKKRKLNRVPAGASDWDVPYPFQPGEGPNEYYKKWPRDYVKRLISELMKLIKSCARKAAMKKYLDQEKSKQRAEEGHGSHAEDLGATKRVDGYYRPGTVLYGVPKEPTTLPSKGEVHDVLKDASNASRNPKIADPTISLSTFSMEDQTGGLPAVQPSMVDSSMPPFSTSLRVEDAKTMSHRYTTSDLSSNNGFNISPTNVENPAFDKNTFDTWMHFLDNFPIISSDNGTNSIMDFSSSTPTSHCSTPALDDLTFPDLFGSNLSNTPSFEASSSNGSEDLMAMLSTLFNQQNQSSDVTAAVNTPALPMINDHMIDPSLLSLSSSNSVNTDLGIIDTNFRNPSVSSPNPSTSSVGTSEPVTPDLAAFDLSLPAVFLEGVERTGVGQGMWGNNLWSGIAYQGGVENDPVDFGLLPEVLDNQSFSLDKGKGKAVDPFSQSSTPVSLPNSYSAPIFIPLPTNEIGNFSAQRTNAITARSERIAKKNSILKLAREKRKRVQEELDSVKMKLWETTVEQASLLNLVRDLEEKEIQGTL